MMTPAEERADIMTSKGRIIKSISGSPTYCWDLLQSYVYTLLFYIYICIYFFNTTFIYLLLLLKAHFIFLISVAALIALFLFLEGMIIVCC